jgi:hypothetical protein
LNLPKSRWVFEELGELEVDVVDHGVQTAFDGCTDVTGNSAECDDLGRIQVVHDFLLYRRE